MKLACILFLLTLGWAQKPADSKPEPELPLQSSTPHMGKLGLLAGAAQQVAIAESNIRNALLNHDADALAKLLAAGYVTIDAEGDLLDRSTFLDRVKQGESNYYRLDLSEMQVHRFGPYLYVLTAREEIGGKDVKGADFTRSCLYSRVWQKQAAGWRAISYQATTIAGAEAPSAP
jgi:ketosteroid isomerase-like protein